MTIDDKNFSFPFVSVRFDAFGAFCLCERSMRSCNQLRNKANTREDRLAVSTPSVGTILKALTNSVSVYRGRDSALRCPRRVQRRFNMAKLARRPYLLILFGR